MEVVIDRKYFVPTGGNQLLIVHCVMREKIAVFLIVLSVCPSH